MAEVIAKVTPKRFETDIFSHCRCVLFCSFQQMSSIALHFRAMQYLAPCHHPFSMTTSGTNTMTLKVQATRLYLSLVTSLSKSQLCCQTYYYCRLNATLDETRESSNSLKIEKQWCSQIYCFAEILKSVHSIEQHKNVITTFNTINYNSMPNVADSQKYNEVPQ